mmetsp:Transcript_93568/g.222435  ORF Transcript_93568/g.222435 Transcript_93568/m.222435 type:complete len:205 (+) Transcript_93568:857-1471(+)
MTNSIAGLAAAELPSAFAWHSSAESSTLHLLAQHLQPGPFHLGFQWAPLAASRQSADWELVTTPALQQIVDQEVFADELVSATLQQVDDEEVDEIAIARLEHRDVLVTLQLSRLHALRFPLKAFWHSSNVSGSPCDSAEQHHPAKALPDLPPVHQRLSHRCSDAEPPLLTQRPPHGEVMSPSPGANAPPRQGSASSFTAYHVNC